MRTKEKRCSTCGDPFVSTKTAGGKWYATCSVECRVAALDRLIAVLQRQRARLAAQVEGER